MKPHTNTSHIADTECMDPTPLVAEKLCKTVRLLGFLIQNGVSKSKVMHDVVQKRGKNIGKALNNAMVRHHEAITCRPRDAHMSYVSPLEYQFSCSSSPPRPSRALAHVSKRRSYTNLSPRHEKGVRMCRGNANDALVGQYHKMERRVKITRPVGSLLKDTAETEFHVDEAAEEFIEKFYRELRLQKWLDHYC